MTTIATDGKSMAGFTALILKPSGTLQDSGGQITVFHLEQHLQAAA